MKSLLKFNLSLLLFFIFSITQLHSQNKSLPDLLIGTWTMDGKSKPQVNDTVSLSKNLLEFNERHPRWLFSVPDNLKQSYAHKVASNDKISISSSHAFKWKFNNDTNLLRIQDEKSDQYFKIVVKDEQTIKLICVK